jgi:hypothetical protein
VKENNGNVEVHVTGIEFETWIKSPLVIHKDFAETLKGEHQYFDRELKIGGEALNKINAYYDGLGNSGGEDKDAKFTLFEVVKTGDDTVPDMI